MGDDVLRSEACETMSGGGRAFGEMMMLGASVGSARPDGPFRGTGIGDGLRELVCGY